MEKWFSERPLMFDFLWLSFLFFLLFYFYKRLRILNKSQSWFVTKGKIIELEWIDKINYMWPKIKYTYEVNDESFTGEHLLLDSTWTTPYSKASRRIAYKAAMAYKNQEEIDIYYNPFDPSQSALDVRLPRKLRIIVYLLFALCGGEVVRILHHWPFF